MLYVNDKLYTFDLHFEKRMVQRKIRLEWIESVMENPDRYELSNVSPNFIYDGHISGYDEPFRVIVNEDDQMIISAYFVKPFPES